MLSIVQKNSFRCSWKYIVSLVDDGSSNKHTIIHNANMPKIKHPIIIIIIIIIILQ